jgi:hypothetical protein
VDSLRFFRFFFNVSVITLDYQGRPFAKA